LVKGSAGFVNLKGCPICTDRRCWFDGREWRCPGCVPWELESRIWLGEPTQQRAKPEVRTMGRSERIPATLLS
jgi:hypothetical protein